jgi:hypothetical protein
MGGHGHSDHHTQGNPNNIQETDSEITSKIRPIELIKHNPNLFHLWIYNPANVLQVLGGAGYAACAASGALFGYFYYSLKLKHTHPTFYTRIFLTASRVALGFFVGSAIGYNKFGDRQRLHNAWVAERLRRRYPESLELEAHDLWKLKGIKASQEFYRWT